MSLGGSDPLIRQIHAGFARGCTRPHVGTRWTDDGSLAMEDSSACRVLAAHLTSNATAPRRAARRCGRAAGLRMDIERVGTGARMLHATGPRVRDALHVPARRDHHAHGAAALPERATRVSATHAGLMRVTPAGRRRRCGWPLAAVGIVGAPAHLGKELAVERASVRADVPRRCNAFPSPHATPRCIKLEAGLALAIDETKVYVVPGSAH